MCHHRKTETRRRHNTTHAWQHHQIPNNNNMFTSKTTSLARPSATTMKLFLMRRFSSAMQRARTSSSFACSTSSSSSSSSWMSTRRTTTSCAPTKLRFSSSAAATTFAQNNNFNSDRRQTEAKTMTGNRCSYYSRASPIMRMSASDNNITADLIESMRTNIREQLEAETVEVMDLSGNGRHVAIKVVSEKFEGKSAVNRQRMVYKAIWMELQDQVHAVNEMVTNTPEEEKKESA